MPNNKDMEYGQSRRFDSQRRKRSDDFDDIVISSPPSKASKATIMCTPHAQSKSLTSASQKCNNSRSSNDDTAFTSPAVPTGSSPTTTPQTSTGSANKAYKGLRHFSLMVCKKVEEKGTTSYNEVADELVRKILDDRYNSSLENALANEDGTIPSPQQPTKFDEKNIRRRVYDALNVLMAMNIISKDKKAIMWKGLPTSLHSASMIFPEGMMQPPPKIETYETIQCDIQAHTKSIQRKREMVKELLLQHVCFRNLVERNYQREESLKTAASAVSSSSKTSAHVQNSNSTTKNQSTLSSSSPSLDTATVNSKGAKTPSPTAITNEPQSKRMLHQPSSSQTKEQRDQHQKKKQLLLDNKIPLPFIVINTNKNAVIQCNMSRDLTDVMFDFTMPFEINDDNSILKRLHLHRTSQQTVRNMLPDHVYKYCVTNHLLDNMIFTDDTTTTAVTKKGQFPTTATTAPTTNVW